MEYVVGIDVGTGSVRGALVDRTGKIWKISTKSVTTWNPKSNFFQQSSDEIWSACCEVIKDITKDIPREDVKGLGFDATCSLAVFDTDGNPLSVDPNGDNQQNIILWMDHRAKAETIFINETEHPILKYVGGNVSPEMMVPKILWLKHNNPRCWQNAAYFFLLPDFLTWRATGDNARSLCSVVCKCNYKASPDGDSGWLKDYFGAIGLEELAENNWKKIGSKIINPGELCGKLNSKAAEETGLPMGTPVAASLIDAHAGGIGLIGCDAESVPKNFTSRLALISGTSTCHMYQTNEKIFVPGIWGPYYNAMMPGLWLLEGGQSASGKLIDHIVNSHPATKLIKEKNRDLRMSEYLNNILYKMIDDVGLTSVDELTRDMHVYPDFYGNRSPLADPNLRGMVLGLTLANDENNLALLYLATIQALAYGTKHIIQELEQHSTCEKVEAVLICGGLSKNDVFVHTHANAIGLPVLVPEEAESVLLGSAMLAASVSGFHADLKTAVLSMAGPAKQVNSEASVRTFHNKKFNVYFELLNSQIKIRKLMQSY